MLVGLPSLVCSFSSGWYSPGTGAAVRNVAEKRACPLCGEPLEDAPAIHDPAKCEKTELLKGRETIKKLTTSLYDWKYGTGGWFELRDIIGRLSWEHNNCPYERKTHDQANRCVGQRQAGWLCSFSRSGSSGRRLMEMPDKPQEKQ